jgi:outer membrane protein OmpA-like peptidoglycan-associated protein
MNSKIIIITGITASVLYIYFSLLNRPIQYVQAPQNNEKKDYTEKTSENNIAEAIIEKAKEERPIIEERIASPAFGFMKGKKNQIVALLSDNDQNGTLSNFIDSLCKNNECNIDIRYQNDIKDATWQKSVVDLLEILSNNNIDNGSLFIESDVLKIEGLIKDYETKVAMDNIFESIKPTLEIEYHTKLSESAQKAADEIESKSNSLDIVQEINETTVVENNITDATINNEKVEENTTIEKENNITKAEPSSNNQEPPKVAASATKQNNTKPISIQKIVKKTVVKPHKDIVATPVMETTLEADTMIVKSIDDEPNLPVQGLVALSIMKTTNDSGTITTQSAAQENITNLLTVKPIQFQNDGKDLTSKSKQTLQEIVKICNDISGNEITINVNNFNSDDTVFNKVISQKMADNITRYMKSVGIKAKVLHSRGHVSEKIISNTGQTYTVDIKIIK